VGKQATSHARRFVACEGTTRRARDPPVRYLDKPLRPSLGATSLNPGVHFSMSEWSAPLKVDSFKLRV
jgi:hypothetical protein